MEENKISVDFDPESAETVREAMVRCCEAASVALEWYCDSKGGTFDTESSIIDLMTDLLHYAKKEGLDGLRLMESARVNFEFEIEEERCCREVLNNSFD